MTRLFHRKKLAAIKAVVFDVDGVLTDGALLATADGDLLRLFDAKDSMAMRIAAMNGLTLGVITGAVSESIVRRMIRCGVREENTILHSRVKMEDFEEFLQRNGLEAREVAYLGDDLPDVPILRAAGLGIAPSDACREARRAADVVTCLKGGKGCVREALEAILKAQGKWTLDNNKYKANF